MVGGEGGVLIDADQVPAGHPLRVLPRLPFHGPRGENESRARAAGPRRQPARRFVVAQQVGESRVAGRRRGPELDVRDGDGRVVRAGIDVVDSQADRACRDVHRKALEDRRVLEVEGDGAAVGECRRERLRPAVLLERRDVGVVAGQDPQLPHPPRPSERRLGPRVIAVGQWPRHPRGVEHAVLEAPRSTSGVERPGAMRGGPLDRLRALLEDVREPEHDVRTALRRPRLPALGRRRLELGEPPLQVPASGRTYPGVVTGTPFAAWPAVRPKPLAWNVSAN